jgi:RNA polymerase sigma factor (sigma-70 family)
MLKPSEEARLIDAWQRGRDASARERVVAAYARLCYRIAAQYARNDDHVEDLAQCGAFGIMRALDMFDPSRGTRFSTYSRRWVQNFVAANAGAVATVVSVPARTFIDVRMGRVPEGRNDPAVAASLGGVPIDAALPGTDGVTLADRIACHRPDPEECAAASSSQRRRVDAIARAMLSLRSREREVLARRRLAEDPETLDDIATDFGVTRERVRQIEVAAIERLRAALEGHGHGADLIG